MTTSKKAHFATRAPFILTVLFAVTFLFCAVLLAIAVFLQDWIFAGILGGLCLYFFISGVARAFSQRVRIYMIIASTSFFVGGMQVIAVLVRWEHWLSLYRSHDFSKYYYDAYDVRAWVPIMIIVVVALLLGAQFYSLHTKNNRFRTAGRPRYE